MYPLVDMEFEDTKVKLVREYKKQLTKHMGKDYMTLPPEDKRTNHCPRVIDFGDAQYEKNTEK
jgi:hypothetical protein